MANSAALRVREFEKAWLTRTLENGIRTVHIPLRDSERFFFAAIYGVGSCYELKEKAGLSHFLEHMMFRGSRQYPSFAELADAFEWLGGEWNAATSHEHTEFTFSGIMESAPKAIELFADFLQYPKFLDIEKEREVILREIEDELNEYGHSTDTSWHMAQLFWPGSHMVTPIAGSLESVKHIKQADLVDHCRRFFTSKNVVLCAVGGRKEDAILDLIEKYFSEVPASEASKIGPLPPLPAYKGPKCRLVEHSDNQYHVQMSFICEGEWSENSAAYAVLNLILSDGFSSRLFKRLREDLGLVYDISIQANLYSTWGSFDVIAAATPDKLLAVIEETCKVLASIVHDGPTQKEIDKSVHRAKIDLTLFTSDHEHLALRTGWRTLFEKDAMISTHMESLDTLSPEVIKATAAKVFSADKCGVVILGPKHSSYREAIEGIVARVLI